MNACKNYVLAAALIGAAMSATASAAMPDGLTFDIPFGFYVSGKLLPAGTYTLQQTGAAAALQIFDNAGNSAFALTWGLVPSGSHRGSRRLVFHRYGDTNFLTQVYWADPGSGLQLPTSQMEKAVARSGQEPTRVAVVRK
jgi:hypothetical protein